MPDEVWEEPRLTPLGVIPVRARRVLWSYWLLLGQLLVHIVAALVWTMPVWSQTQDVINERQVYALQTLETRVTRTERDVDALRPITGQVLLLQEIVNEQKWLIRGVTLAVVGQLVVLVLGGRLSRPE